MYQMDKVYIVVKYLDPMNDNTIFIESTWSTRELADAACIYHAFNDSQVMSSEYNPTQYQVIERAINKAHRV